MTAAAATWFCCALCGWRFSHVGLACGACPMRRGCEVIRCPSCGYQFPRSSTILDWLRRLFARSRSESR